MKKKLQVSALLVFCIMIADLLSIAHITLFGITDILWLVLLLPVFGALVLTNFLRPKDFSCPEWLIYAWGVALVCLITIGLLLNTLGLELGFRVFTRGIIFPVFNVIFVLLIGLWVFRSKDEHLFPDFWQDLDVKVKLRILAPLLLPVISILGAVRLNNGGTNNLALLTVVIALAYPLVLALSRKSYEQEYVTSLLATGLALMLSVSMRSNYVLGFDIHQEFQVFSATVQSGLWHPHLYNNAYNACLSITVFPAMLKTLLPISADYTFKFAMQAVFAVMPIIVYVLARRRFNKQLFAYLAALFFIVQGQYIFEFPGLVRQQLALIFFGLIFTSASSPALSRTAKSAFLVIFGMATVTSHYSTTYVTIALLILIILLKPLFVRIQSLFRVKAKDRTVGISWYISPLVVLIILLTAFLWYGETLQASGGIGQKVVGSVKDFSSIFNADSHSAFVTTTFGGSSFNYTSSTLQQVSEKQAVPGGYKPSLNQYQPQPASPNGVSINNTAESILFNFEHKFIPLLAGALVGIGILYLLYESLRGQRQIDDGVLAIAGGILFVLLAVLPNLSQDYNLERLYQQLLILLSPALIYGLIVLLKRFIRMRLISVVACCLTLLYLVGTAGILDQAVFGISNINLVNNGANYDRYFVTDAEISTLKWLQSSANDSSVADFDRYSILNARAYTSLPATTLKEGVLPSQVTQNSYLYESRTNLHDNLATEDYQNQVLNFNFPAAYLAQNKDTLYTSGDSEVLR